MHARRLVLPAVLALALACDDSTNPNNGQPATDVALDDVSTDVAEDADSTSEDVTPSDTADPDDTHIIDDADTTSDASETDAVGDTSAPTEPYVSVRFDRDWIHTEVEGDAVDVSCRYLNADGDPLDNPGDFELTAPADAIDADDGRFAFEESGTYSFECASASLGLSATRELVVAFEGIDYRYVQTTQVLSEYGPVIDEIIDANADLDRQAYSDAVDRLEALPEAFPDLSGVEILTDNPHGWPTVQNLRDEGLNDGPDDAAWVAALDDLEQAVAAERAALAQLSDSPAPDDLVALEQATVTTRTAHAALAGLNPSEIAVWEHREEAGALLEEMAETARVRSERLAAMFRANPPSVNFSLVGTLASIAINEAIGSYTYKAILTDLGKAIVANMISIAIKDLINRGFVADANSPHLSSVHGSAGGFVGAGNPFTAVGDFNADHTKMRIVFIPPTISNELAGIVDIVDSVNGITQQRNVLKLVNTLRKLIKQLINTYGAAAGAGEQFIVLTPDSGDNGFLQFPALPSGLNCSRFQTPVAGTMIPLDFDWGRGEAININVLGEPESACN